MPSKHISPSAYTSSPLVNSPHALKTYFTQCKHLKPPFQLPASRQNTFHPAPTGETPFATAPKPSKHILPSANTSNPLFTCPHALESHVNHCQHLKPPFSPAPMLPQHISPSANTSQPLCNCPHALKSDLTQCQHLKSPLQLPPCPQKTFHPVPTPQTPFETACMPSNNISPSANTSNRLFNFPYALKTYFNQCQHLKPPLQLPPCSQNTFHPVPTPQTPFATAPKPSNQISPSANTSKPICNCPHALKTHFTQCQHLKPPL